jgi:hypothetical protein
VKLKDAKTALCPNQRCWRCRGFTDGGITVALGIGWCAFMLEEHCANKRKCMGAAGRKGEMCDAIAVHMQDSNDIFRIIEAKRGGLASKAMIQLQRGADYLDAAVGPTVKAQFTAELYMGPGPRTTARAFSSVKIRSRSLVIPIKVITT